VDSSESANAEVTDGDAESPQDVPVDGGGRHSAPGSRFLAEADH
jgi:hypothetical protein